uniref:WKF domain-containing protein n=1 Tax=Culex tarsalis TaxID=7177 RepID=A0A1Q3F7X5_CULTA
MAKRKDKQRDSSKADEKSHETSKQDETANPEPIPAKKSKKDSHTSPEAATISAGTTIDQAMAVNPKLKLNKKTKRAKKREKHAKIQEEKQEKSKDRERQEVQQYLQAWRDEREKWKFQKLKQIYIQEHVFDEDRLAADVWPIALEYLSGTKGSGKETLTKRAQTVIREADQQAKEGEDQSVLEGSRYQRARELLQYLG